MTPREGVVAWGLFDKYGLTDHYETERDALKRAEAAEKDHPRNGPYTVSALCAHPAATAREESIRAEVIEECARVCEARAAKHHGTFTEDLGESYELGWREDEGKDCAKAIRALALARSTGGDK